MIVEDEIQQLACTITISDKIDPVTMQVYKNSTTNSYRSHSFKGKNMILSLS